MEKQGIMDKIIGPTELFNNLVIRGKGDGQLHISLDPKYLNKAIIWEYPPIPTAEQLMTKLCGSTIFFKVRGKPRILECKT